MEHPMSANYDNNSVPASLIEQLANKFYADKEADRQLARDIMVQFSQIATAMMTVATKMEEERAERRRVEERNERAEREERARQERIARRS
jgi:hypothetical protein